MTALAFQHGTHTLYSGACDRTVKLWNMTEQAYLDTVYGHQAPVHSIDALSRERCLTSGADRSVRLWKIVEDSQLVFNGHAGNIDCVSMLNEESFLSGGEDGEVCLWSTTKKKPVASASHIHEMAFSWAGRGTSPSQARTGSMGRPFLRQAGGSG